MTAAVITPTIVMKRIVPYSVVYGATERRLMELYLEGPKAAQSDWFLLSEYIEDAECANVVSVQGTIALTGGLLTTDVETALSYANTAVAANAKLTLGGAQVGTSTVTVMYYTE
jgi:hypothetical protein